MRSIALSLLTFSMLFSCADSGAKEIKNPKMDDPIMGLTYETAKVKFDSCPRSLDSREGAAKGYQWIYAECARPLDTLYIVSCLMKSWNDQSEKWIDSVLEPDFGAIIKLSSGKSKAIGTPDGLYGKHAVLPVADADCLMEDAATRYIKAFGGAAELQKSLVAKNISAEALPAAFVEKLKVEGVIIPVKKGK